MRSMDERFWSAVGKWCNSKPKALIAVECSGLGGHNFEAFRGTITDFSEGESITFVLDDGSSRPPLLLRGCKAMSSSTPKPGRDLDEWGTVCTFNLVCGPVEEAKEEFDPEVVFTFTELRGFGEPI
jgi:hypothetical protein